MCNKFKKIDIKNTTCYFLDDINIKILVPSKFKIDKKSKKKKKKKISLFIPLDLLRSKTLPTQKLIV